MACQVVVGERQYRQRKHIRCGDELHERAQPMPGKNHDFIIPGVGARIPEPGIWWRVIGPDASRSGFGTTPAPTRTSTTNRRPHARTASNLFSQSA